MRNIGKVLLLSTSLLVGEVVTPVIPSKVQLAYASSTIKLANISYQTIDNVNLRTGPSTKYKAIFLVPKSKTIRATEQKGTWVKVSYQYTLKGKRVVKTGWVSASYIKKISTAPKTVKFAKTTYQTTDNVNIRSGASTKYKTLLTIPKGKTIISAEKVTDWYKVTYTYSSKGKNATTTGWVKGNFLKEYYKYNAISGGYYFTKKTVKLYSTPDTKKSGIYSLASGNGLYSAYHAVNSVGQVWYRVSYNGKTLYVYSGEVSKATLTSFAAAEYQAKLDTYLYVSYGKAYTKLVKIPKQTIISSNQKIGDWYKVSYNGKSGYVYSGDITKYTKPAETPDTVGTDNGEVKNPPTDTITEQAVTKTTYAVTDQLNLRQAAATTAAILTVIPRGSIIIPTSKTSNGWYKVSYAGKSGYVFGTYLQQVISGDPMGSRDTYQFIDLRTPSLVTASQINNYIAGYVKSTGKSSVLTNKGQVFIDAGKKYGVNPLYLAAHAIHESAYGTSSISITKNNLFGFGAYDAAPFVAAYRFASVELCIDYIAREMKSTYLNPVNWKYQGAYLGFSTKTLTNERIDASSEGMNFFYASDPNWGKVIGQHMEKILSYDKAYYAKADTNTDVPTRPSIPDGGDVFPADIKTIVTLPADKQIVLNSKKGVHDSVKTLKNGNSFYILEKTNDFWLRVKVDNKEYWTNDVDFSNFKNYISVQNLGRVTVSELNIRTGPSTSNSSLGKLPLNDYVSIVMKADGTLTIDSTKAWYQVKTANGSKGWVSAAYIYTRDLK
ncbi:SH3 domain-containing protein [Neobacillus sp. SuZ13]|uniref:SH3 domain-containing protein n=1 Tax=Neobacillus sp. SuZ13 TaxID=3047875 RepID=UPI0024BF60CD|nr:SH3 domain-containing protein [Neobacillus sp. SuZ13]WHY66358.1 SH3 domain-containing protein [Neobacillus sp. SuZ13]